MSAMDSQRCLSFYVDCTLVNLVTERTIAIRYMHPDRAEFCNILLYITISMLV